MTWRRDGGRSRTLVPPRDAAEDQMHLAFKYASTMVDFGGISFIQSLLSLCTYSFSVSPPGAWLLFLTRTLHSRSLAKIQSAVGCVDLKIKVMIGSAFSTVVLFLQGMCNVLCPQTQEELGAAFSCYNCFLISLTKISLLPCFAYVLGAPILMFL